MALPCVCMVSVLTTQDREQEGKASRKKTAIYADVLDLPTCTLQSLDISRHLVKSLVHLSRCLWRVLISFIINLLWICPLCISDRAYQVVLLSLASCLSFMNILLDLETSEHRIRVVVSQAADRVLTLKDTFKISKVWNLCFMRRLSSLQKANHDIKPCFNSVVFCLFVLLYLQLHQHWYSAGFLRNDFKFHYRSCITFLPIFFLIFLQSADFISFLPSHFSILSCLRNKHCWNTLETYLPNDNFLFITASGD